MSYRRPHHRRAHIRTNSDGSKSYVSKAFVRGHKYNKEETYYSNDKQTHNVDNPLGGVAFLIGVACLILFLLGLILGWGGVDLLIYAIIFIICLVVFCKSENLTLK